jgi:hypothetical protein
MRTEKRWKAVQRITHCRLAHTPATCPLCSRNRHGKTSQRSHRQDRVEGREFAIEGRERMQAAQPASYGLIREYCACGRNHRRAA